MKVPSFCAVWSIGLFCNLAASASIPRYFEEHSITRRDLTSAQVQHELGGQVSKSTLIFGPGNSLYPNTTSRWTNFSKPKIEVVVEPGTEADVATIVKYCNANSIEFIALNGGHGISASLGAFDGIQIGMRQLDSIEIQPNATSAWFGGGTIVGPVVDYLWEKGYIATTGGCECVGMMGAGLGGGHGRQEGIYGLIIDNIRQLNVVLADGSAIRINATSYSDLFWGMKGAGHNFGIVTSYEMNIFPRGPATWHYHNYVWRGEQLESVFNALNVFHGNDTTPVNMAYNVGSFLMNATISKTEPVIYWTFAYRGPGKEAEKLLAPFNAIKPAWEQMDDVPYTDIASAQGYGMEDPICQHGSVHSTATAFLVSYNVTAERLIFETFQKHATENPAIAAGTSIMHEGYSTERVESIDPNDSAYPFRDDRHLMLFNAIVPDGSSLEVAWAWAREVRDNWNAGQPTVPVAAYINYANGFESLEQHYGYDSWRIERLQGLKAKYDPNNRFRYFCPIVPYYGEPNANLYSSYFA